MTACGSSEAMSLNVGCQLRFLCIHLWFVCQTPTCTANGFATPEMIAELLALPTFIRGSYEAGLITSDEERLDVAGIEYLASLSSYPGATPVVLLQRVAGTGRKDDQACNVVDDHYQLGSLS
ncbi:hypothetical protein P3T76_006360 [Phytophthora citrophthora]|uniref:Uncharacterized protein n=1 Tax=Phytophthora citrophthora TaxID=4793 RepID=A0AAD9LM19_9STRA|nr:hypothetical protein P3T76_006360 [Phytophthora citrophthora]